MGGERISLSVKGPLEAPVDAYYGYLEESNTAIMEMATASGITLIPREALNPMKATTYGVGEMIKDAIRRGIRNFIIGIGGSATNDGGTGMLTALGYEFLDADGQPVGFGGQCLEKIVSISAKTDWQNWMNVISGLPATWKIHYADQRALPISTVLRKAPPTICCRFWTQVCKTTAMLPKPLPANIRWK